MADVEFKDPDRAALAEKGFDLLTMTDVALFQAH
jgi:hypothetical protein